jgi:hypothetical protein
MQDEATPVSASLGETRAPYLRARSWVASANRGQQAGRSMGERLYRQVPWLHALAAETF